MSIIIIAAVFVAIGCLISIRVMGHQYERKWAKDIGLSLSFSCEQAEEGEFVWLYETVTNQKNMILPAISVKFKTSRYLEFQDVDSGSVSDYFYRNDVLSVRGYEQVRRRLRVKCVKRGEYAIDEAELVGHDPLLRKTYLEKMPANARLTVYPSHVDMRRIRAIFEKSYGDMSSHLPLFEDPFEYRGVREYLPGDAMNRINWKASARTGQWQVKTSAYKAGEPAVIMLNLVSPGTFTNHSAMEENIRIAYSLVCFLSQNGIESTLVTNGGDGFYLQGCGQKYVGCVRQKLAGVSYATQIRSAVEMLEKESRSWSKNTHLFFVSSEGKEEIREALTRIRRQEISLNWIAVLSGGEDDTRQMPPQLETCLCRWKI